MEGIRALLFVLFLPAAVSAGSHSLAMVITYIKGETPFPELSLTLMLDDLTIGYFDSKMKTLFPRGLVKEQEDDGVIDPDHVKTISSFLLADLNRRHLFISNELNYTESIQVQQKLVACELLDNDQPGPLITKNAIRGTTRDEMSFHEHKLTYKNVFNYTAERLKPLLELTRWRHEHIYYPVCIKTLREYLKKRMNQVKRKVKPRVRLIQKRHSVSGWDGVTCLATGFYPRHINLTILRDGQPVPDHLITGGDLLPNVDGTYQMKKNLELSEEELKKHSYTCTVTHLSLDNKLDIHLDFDPGEPIGPILGSVFAALVLVCVTVAVIWMICRRKQRASSMGGYSSASTTEKSETSLDTTKKLRQRLKRRPRAPIKETKTKNVQFSL
ncbi:major histocompatibility complex class I-related gene protein-like [Colossoma macropomum]|uniref:major histocompatibility complex class I-related gene protein-like n=1 Tax=Colossoma macropomum TaxID=42526 RepID=UPI00186427B3|nr:major histocompatibility complex class I-related gene protein-like [Colossoma macropomum]